MLKIKLTLKIRNSGIVARSFVVFFITVVWYCYTVTAALFLLNVCNCFVCFLVLSVCLQDCVVFLSKQSGFS